MQNPEVELMIYGEDVADDAVSLATGNVKVSRVKALDSENYLFVTLDTSGAQAQDLVLTLTDNDRSQRTVHYPLEKRKEGSASRKGFGPEDAIYLIAPDRFANGNTANDNVDGYQDKVDSVFWSKAFS